MKRAIAVLLVALLLGGCGTPPQNEPAATSAPTPTPASNPEEYYQKLHDFKILTLSGGADAEGIGNMVVGVWRDTIYKDFSTKTVEYTRDENGKYHDDFNTSLKKYFSSDEYADAKEKIEENLILVDKMYLDIKHPYEGCEDAFEIVDALYKEYERLASIALNITGSLKTYSEEFSGACTSYMNAYNKLDRHFNAIDFEPKIIAEN